MRLGAILWLSTRSRVDLAWSQSVAASVLFGDIEGCTQRTNHMLAYIASTPDLALHYKKPASQNLQLDVYTDASFCPDGSASRTGLVQMLCVTQSICHMRTIKAFAEELFCQYDEVVRLHIDNTATITH
eukprot:5983402-Amphidinium_carterae.1